MMKRRRTIARLSGAKTLLIVLGVFHILNQCLAQYQEYAQRSHHQPYRRHHHHHHHHYQGHSGGQQHEEANKKDPLEQVHMESTEAEALLVPSSESEHNNKERLQNNGEDDKQQKAAAIEGTTSTFERIVLKGSKVRLACPHATTTSRILVEEPTNRQQTESIIKQTKVPSAAAASFRIVATERQLGQPPSEISTELANHHQQQQRRRRRQLSTNIRHQIEWFKNHVPIAATFPNVNHFSLVRGDLTSNGDIATEIKRTQNQVRPPRRLSKFDATSAQLFDPRIAGDSHLSGLSLVDSQRDRQQRQQFEQPRLDERQQELKHSEQEEVAVVSLASSMGDAAERDENVNERKLFKSEETNSPSIFTTKHQQLEQLSSNYHADDGKDDGGNFNWPNENKEGQKNLFYINAFGELVITDVSESSAGIYTCQYGDKQSELKLDVLTDVASNDGGDNGYRPGLLNGEEDNYERLTNDEIELSSSEYNKYPLDQTVDNKNRGCFQLIDFFNSTTTTNSLFNIRMDSRSTPPFRPSHFVESEVISTDDLGLIPGLLYAKQQFICPAPMGTDLIQYLQRQILLLVKKICLPVNDGAYDTSSHSREANPAQKSACHSLATKLVIRVINLIWYNNQRIITSSYGANEESPICQSMGDDGLLPIDISWFKDGELLDFDSSGKCTNPKLNAKLIDVRAPVAVSLSKKEETTNTNNSNKDKQRTQEMFESLRKSRTDSFGARDRSSITSNTNSDGTTTTKTTTTNVDDSLNSKQQKNRRRETKPTTTTRTTNFKHLKYEQTKLPACPFRGLTLEIDGINKDDAGRYTCALKLNITKLDKIFESLRQLNWANCSHDILCCDDDGLQVAARSATEMVKKTKKLSTKTTSESNFVDAKSNQGRDGEKKSSSEEKLNCLQANDLMPQQQLQQESNNNPQQQTAPATIEAPVDAQIEPIASGAAFNEENEMDTEEEEQQRATSNLFQEQKVHENLSAKVSRDESGTNKNNDDDDSTTYRPPIGVAPSSGGKNNKDYNLVLAERIDYLESILNETSLSNGTLNFIRDLAIWTESSKSITPETLQTFVLVVSERSANSCSVWSTINEANNAYSRRKLYGYRRLKRVTALASDQHPVEQSNKERWVVSIDKSSVSAIAAQHKATLPKQSVGDDDYNKFDRGSHRAARKKRSSLTRSDDETNLHSNRLKSKQRNAILSKPAPSGMHSVNIVRTTGQVSSQQRKSIDLSGDANDSTISVKLPYEPAATAFPLNNSVTKERLGEGRRKSSGDSSLMTGKTYASLDVEFGGNRALLNSIGGKHNATTNINGNPEQQQQAERPNSNLRETRLGRADSGPFNYANEVNLMHHSSGSNIGKLNRPTNKQYGEPIGVVSSTNVGGGGGDVDDDDEDGTLEQQRQQNQPDQQAAIIVSGDIRNNKVIEKSPPIHNENIVPLSTSSTNQSDNLTEANQINEVVAQTNEPSLELFYHNNNLSSSSPLTRRQPNNNGVVAQAINKTNALKLNNYSSEASRTVGGVDANTKESLNTRRERALYSHRNNTINLKRPQHYQRQQQRQPERGGIKTIGPKNDENVLLQDDSGNELTSPASSSSPATQSDRVEDDNHPIDNVIVPSFSALNRVDLPTGKTGQPTTGQQQPKQRAQRHKRSPSVIDDLQDISTFSSIGSIGGGGEDSTRSRVIDGARNWYQLGRRSPTLVVAASPVQQKHEHQKSRLRRARREEKSEIVSTIPPPSSPSSASSNNLIDDDQRSAQQADSSGSAKAIQSLAATGRTNRRELFDKSEQEASKTKNTLAYGHQWVPSSSRPRSKVEQKSRGRTRSNTRRDRVEESERRSSSGHDPSREHKLRRRLKTRYEGRQDLSRQNGDKSAANIETSANAGSVLATTRRHRPSISGGGGLPQAVDNSQMNGNGVGLGYALGVDNHNDDVEGDDQVVDNLRRRVFANGQYQMSDVKTRRINNDENSQRAPDSFERRSDTDDEMEQRRHERRGKNEEVPLNSESNIEQFVVPSNDKSGLPFVVVQEVDVDKMAREAEQQTTGLTVPLTTTTTTLAPSSNDDGYLIGSSSSPLLLPLSFEDNDEEAGLLWSVDQYLYLHMRAFAALSLYGIQVDVEWSNERANETDIDLESDKMDDEAGNGEPEPLPVAGNRQRRNYEPHWRGNNAPFATIDLVPGQNLHLECTAQALGRLPEVKWFKRIKNIPAHLDRKLVNNLVRHINHEAYWPLTQLDLLTSEDDSSKPIREKRFVCSQSITIFDNLVNQTFTVVNSLQLSQYNDFTGTSMNDGGQINHPAAERQQALAAEESPLLRPSEIDDNFNLYACIVDADVRHNYATLGVNFRTRISSRTHPRPAFVDKTNSPPFVMDDGINQLNAKRQTRQLMDRTYDTGNYDASTRFNLLRENHIIFPMNEFWVPIKNGSYLEENAESIRTAPTDFGSYSITPAILSTIIVFVFSSLLALVYLTLKSYQAMTSFNRMEDDELIVELMKQSDDAFAVDGQQQQTEQNQNLDETIHSATAPTILLGPAGCENAQTSCRDFHSYDCTCGYNKPGETLRDQHYSGEYHHQVVNKLSNSNINFCLFHDHEQTLIASSSSEPDDSLALMNNHFCHLVSLDEEQQDSNGRPKLYDAYLDLIEPSSNCRQHLKSLPLSLPPKTTHLHPSTITSDQLDDRGDNDSSLPYATHTDSSTHDSRIDKLPSCCHNEVTSPTDHGRVLSLSQATMVKTSNTINMVENPLNANY